jgi:hypothetical protein
MAITSMVTGIVAIPGICVYVWPGLVLAIIAVVFGGVAISGMRKSGNDEGKGMAIAGLVLGLIVTGIAALVIIVGLVMFASFMPHNLR